MNKLLYHIMQAEGYEQDKLLPFLTKAQDGVEVPPVTSVFTDGMPQLNIPAPAEEDYRWRTIIPSQVPVMPQQAASAPSKPVYRGASLVDYLKSQGMDSSKAARKKLAEEFRVQNYDFSAAKNLELLGRLYDNNEDEQTAAQIFRLAERAKGSEQPTRKATASQNKGRRISPEEFNRRLSLTMGYDVTQGIPADRFTINTQKLSLSPKVKYDKFSLVPRMEYKGLSFGLSKPATQPAASPAQQQQAVAPVTQPPAVNNTGFRFDLNPTAKPNPNALFNFNPLGLPYPTARTNNATPVKSRSTANVSQQPKPASVDKPWYEDAWDAVSGTVSEAWDDAGDLASDAWNSTTSAASQAWDAAGNTLNSWWDAYSKAVNENPYLKGSSMTMSPAGFTPQGAISMTRDFTSNVLGIFSDDWAQKYDNWVNRQQAFNNMEGESKSKIIVPPYNYAPMYMTGDTIPDGNRQYHLPESMDVNALRFGVRNRGEFSPIETEAASITSFHPFVDAKKYFNAGTEDPANATYLAVSPDGRLQIGGRKDFEGKDVRVSRVFSNKVVDFVREPSGSIKKVPAGAKVNRNAFSPAVNVINDDGKIIQGKLNLALPQGENGDEAFGIATGGRFILQTPDGQTRLVSGSLKNIEEEFKRIKGNNPYVNIISLDNGSFSRGLRTRDQKLTAEDLRAYDNLNTSGGNFAYLLPNQIKSRPEAKFAEFEKEATRILQSKYPGRKVEVRFQQDGLYDKKGGRDISSQEGIQKEGNSQTKVSLHNFGAARDYVLLVDGKPIDANFNKGLYKDVLWTAADNTGTYHLEDWDPTHISLAKEGQKTAFDEMKAKYPELLNTELFKKNLEYIRQRKDQDEEYRVLYELMTNFQPFTGKPRTVAPKKAFGGSMVEGYEYPVQDDNIFVSAFGAEAPKFQTGGEKVKIRNSNGRVIEVDTASRKYKRLYNEGIGRWQKFDPATKRWVSSNESDPNAEFVSSAKELPEVVVTGKYKPNTVGSYTRDFYNQNPYEQFYRNRYDQLKGEFTSQPQWAQSAVGGWGKDSRQQNIKDQINQEYQQKYVDFVSQNLQSRTPQGSQRRDKWLSGRNFTDKELGFLTGSTNLPQPSLWAQGLQGAYNVADMVSLGQLPEENMPGIAKAEVSQYNNPLLALSPLAIPAKMVQSVYKDNYSLGDALSGRPNNAGIVEDIATDPLTYLSFGTKPLFTGASRLSRFSSPYLSKASRFVPQAVKNNFQFLKNTKGAGVTQLPESGYVSGSYVPDYMKGVEVVDPETGVSKILYNLEENLPSPPEESFDWIADSFKKINTGNSGGIELTDDIMKGWGISGGFDNTNQFLTTKGSFLQNIQSKLGKVKNQMFPPNTSDYTKRLSSLDDYKRWGRSIHPELSVVDPAVIRNSHRRAIDHFKKTGQIQSMTDPAKEMGLFVRQELADRIPSFADPVVTYPGTGERLVYGQGTVHPSLFNADEQARYFQEVTNNANLTGERAMQEAQPLTDWGYDITRLTPQENSLVHAYAKGYDEKFNAAARKNMPSRFFGEKAEELNTAIQKNKFPTATQVRRGVNDHLVELLDPVTFKPTGVKKRKTELTMGDVYKDDGFMSTSLYTDYNWGQDAASEIIDIPGGGVQSYAFPNAMSSSPYFPETEAILPKGLIRRVEEVRTPSETGVYPNNARFRTKILNPYNLALPLLGSAAFSQVEKKKGGPVVSSFGQWAYPGQRTIVPTPTGQITMKGVPYPVYGQDETGFAQMMYPGGEYTFPGQMVNEIPMMGKGGQHGGLDRWFAEKWVDVKTGKPCGRQEGESRAYPACRPSRRVSSETPKTASEMSPAEKAKFKRSKTSSERINYNHKRKQYGGMSTMDSVRHQADKILKYEQLRGGPGGAPLPQYSDPKYMNMLMNDIYPQIKKILPNATAMEAAEAMDFVFNAGWDKASNKILKDPRAYALQEYYKQYNPSKLDADGKWSGRKNPAYSFDQEYNSTIGMLPENDRRVLMNKGRDWYYKNINNPTPGVPNDDYYNTWYGRIWNTNDFLPFNPNNPNFKPKKEQGGEMIRRADGSYSPRGLWDNIRANKGSGKKPTKQMLEQERKIKAKSK